MTTDTLTALAARLLEPLKITAAILVACAIGLTPLVITVLALEHKFLGEVALRHWWP